MKTWDRRITFVVAAMLCLVSVGHASGYPSVSHALGASGIDDAMVEALRTVWLTVSLMFAFFGLSLVRVALRPDRRSRMWIVAIGVVLALAGTIGLVVSGGKPFWVQHLVVGAVVGAIGWRLPRGDAPEPSS